jgi:polysaccharide export outer membrane protein
MTATVAVLFTVAGCGGSRSTTIADVPEQYRPEPAIVDLTDPTKPVPAERFVHLDAARIAPGDVLDLRVLGFPELSGSFRVAPDGRINLSLIGGVQASGKTPEELDKDITNAMSAYYRNLDVALNVNTPAERNVYVLGQVTRPGRLDFKVGERVLHALADAGGLVNGARENSIMLLRREEDGRDHAYRLDFSQIHTQLAPRDIYLQPGDVVFVPKAKFQTVYEFSNNFLEVLSRGATTALVIDELQRRTQELVLPR